MIDQATKKQMMMMESCHVSDDVVEMGPVTDKFRIATTAISIVGRVRDVSNISEAQFEDAARRAVASGLLESDEVEQSTAHAMDLFGRVHSESVDDLFEAEVGTDIDDLFELVEKSIGDRISQGWDLFWLKSALKEMARENPKVRKHSDPVLRSSPSVKDLRGLFRSISKALPEMAGYVSQVLGEDMSEGYAKAGDTPDWGNIESTYDKLVMNQDLSQEEPVGDTRGDSTPYPWEMAPDKSASQVSGYDLDEGFYRRGDKKLKRSEWMRRYQKVAVQRGAKVGKIDWDAAHHFFFQGFDAEKAATKIKYA